MKFKFRNIPGYLDVRVILGGTVVNLGLLDDSERMELARTLEEAVDELTGGLSHDNASASV